MKPNEFLTGKALELIRLVSGKGEMTGFTKYLNNIEYKSTEELISLQAFEMSKMLKHTVERIPFYSEFKGKLELSPETVHDDIKEFPVMTRDMVAKHYDELIDKGIKGGTRLLGGGTTGTQTITIRGRHEILHSADGYFDGLVGLHPGKSKLLIRRTRSANFADKPSEKKYIYNPFTRTSIVNPAYMDKEKLEFLYRVYKCKRPKAVVGITETVYRFCEYIKSNELKTYKVDMIGTGSQTMLPRYKELIGSVFKDAVLIDGYGSNEFGRMAQQCTESNGYHYIPLIHYIEAVDSEYKNVPNGETGQLLVTTLQKRKMPLIRYRVDDLVTISDGICDCGRGYPLVERFEGRRIESIVSPKKTYMSPLPFFEIMGGFSNVDEFKVEQRSDNEVTLILKMKSGKFTNVQTLAVRKEINRYLDYPMKLSVEYVDRIEPMPNGKIMRVRGLESFLSEKK
jgi:phenylacetate-CoA ligase